MTRRRVDLRLVRRALRHAERRVLLGENGGFTLRWVGAGERAGLWQQLRGNYAGPGGATGGDYMGYEFVNSDGEQLMYIEIWC
jgi:hypothetical protein